MAEIITIITAVTVASTTVNATEIIPTPTHNSVKPTRVGQEIDFSASFASTIYICVSLSASHPPDYDRLTAAAFLISTLNTNRTNLAKIKKRET